MINELGQGLTLLERLGNASPLVFAMAIAALSLVGNWLLSKHVIRQYQKLGRTKAMLVGHYVADGKTIEEAEQTVSRLIDDE